MKLLWLLLFCLLTGCGTAYKFTIEVGDRSNLAVPLNPYIDFDWTAATQPAQTPVPVPAKAVAAAAKEKP